MGGAFSTKGPIKLQFFTGNMDSIKYIDILKHSKVDIDELHPDGFLLLCDNDSKHRSGLSLDYYIMNNIILIEWPAYRPDLNPIENVWANIKYKLGGQVYSKMEELKKDIEYYWSVYAKDYSEIIEETMKKRINTCILRKGKKTGY